MAQHVSDFLSKVFVSSEDANLFKKYILNILEHKENKYGVLVIPGNTAGDALMYILRNSLGKYYNRYDSPRTGKERLIRHDDVESKSLNVIKENPSCHHVYNWCKDVTDILNTYEREKIQYTVCNINAITESTDMIVQCDFHILLDLVLTLNIET
jgi:hypothetical protein